MARGWKEELWWRLWGSPGQWDGGERAGQDLSGIPFSSARGRGAGLSWELERLGGRGTEALFLYFSPDFQSWD